MMDRYVAWAHAKWLSGVQPSDIRYFWVAFGIAASIITPLYAVFVVLVWLAYR